MSNSKQIHAFRTLLGSRTELVARVAAALWARVGRPVNVEDLKWIEPLLGGTGPQILHGALMDVGAISSARLLEARGVAQFCTVLIGNDSNNLVTEIEKPSLVWTLPACHPGQTTRGASYAAALLDLIEHACDELILISPFIDEPGIGRLTAALLTAMRRKVKVVILTVNATNLASFTSRAVEGLRREAERAKADLTVHTADPGIGKDRDVQPLLHAKIVIRDRAQVLLGSANLTSYAFSSNFEAGVLLGPEPAAEAHGVVAALLESRQVHLVFCTASVGGQARRHA